jgi:hypothetical protein
MAFSNLFFLKRRRRVERRECSRIASLSSLFQVGFWKIFYRHNINGAFGR